MPIRTIAAVVSMLRTSVVAVPMAAPSAPRLGMSSRFKVRFAAAANTLTSTIAQEIALTGSNGLAVGEGAVWVIDKLTGVLAAIDPGSGEEAGSAPLPGNLDAVFQGIANEAVQLCDANAAVIWRCAGSKPIAAR